MGEEENRFVWQVRLAAAALRNFKGPAWLDVFILIGVGGLLCGLVDFAHQWTVHNRQSVTIDLSPAALPRYAFYSLMRGLIAYSLSLLFSIVYGYWAARDARAERLLMPLLDVLQSIPLLGFMPGLLLAMVAIFPHSNLGIEMAAILMIFTSQAWNMTFSFHHSLKSIPSDFGEVAGVFGFSAWQRFRWVELPFSTVGLVWNSMMSMAGGWFFLMISEAFRLGDKDFRLAGIGSYMAVAVDKGRVDSMFWAVLAMTTMIVLLDQILWRPVVVWSQKFRVEEGGRGDDTHSWFLDWISRSRLIEHIGNAFANVKASVQRKPATKRNRESNAGWASQWHSAIPRMLLVVLLAGLAFGAWRLFALVKSNSLSEWSRLIGLGGVTLSRVMASTLLGTLWAVPVGLAIGLSPRLSRVLQPVVQILASFPAPMLFPLAIAILDRFGITLGWGSIALMLLGTQWYILFNVLAGALSIPSDLIEAAFAFRITGWRLWRTLYLPAVFPFLVTGWVTAAGGAWNASIVAEFVTYKHETRTTIGLGSAISQAAEAADFPKLAAAIVVMSVIVVAFNRLVWRKLYALAESRYSLSK